MSISDNYAPDKSSGNGVTVAFTGNWNVIASSYMRVYWEDKTTGVQTLKTLGTHYTLAFTSSGYTVTHDALYVPPSTVWVIRAREIAKDQTDPYRTSTGFQGKVVEDSFDKLTAITQDIQDQLDRAPKLPLGSSTTLLPMEAPEAGKALMWNATADGIINSEDDFDDIVTDAEAAAAAAAASAAAALVSENNAETAEIAAELAETNAETAETNAEAAAAAAAVSAAAALTSENNAETAETNAEAAQAAAEAAQAAAETAETNAETAETNAETAETNAETAEANAEAAQAAAEAARDIAKAAGGFTYTYDTDTTASDPTAGFLRFNNATLASATALYISETTGLAQAIAAEIATWDDSTSTIHTKLRMFQQANPAIFAIFNVTGTLTDNGTWDTLTVAYVVGSGVFADNDVVTMQPIRNGDKGDTGATGPAGSVPIAAGAGTVDAITANFTPDIALNDMQLCVVISTGANTVTNPTLAPDGLTARTIVKKGGVALVAGDTGAAGYPLLLEYNLANTRWELLNPAKSTEADLVLADNATNDSSTTKHGFLKKLSNSAQDFMDGAGNWSTAISKVLTGFTSGAGTVSSADTILSAIQKIDGNVPVAASQADQETSTSAVTFVSPARQQFHPSAAKFWYRSPGDNTMTSSYNMTSVTDNGTGRFTGNIATDFSNANWSAAGLIKSSQAADNQTEFNVLNIKGAANIAAGTVPVRTDKLTIAGVAFTTVDIEYYIVGFGDQ